VSGERQQETHCITNSRLTGDPKGGKYVASVQSKVFGAWFDIDNLVVSETHAQKLALSESYVLVYERNAK
jgi:ubiquitin C-terminal hydrolase